MGGLEEHVQGVCRGAAEGCAKCDVEECLRREGGGCRYKVVGGAGDGGEEGGRWVERVGGCCCEDHEEC